MIFFKNALMYKTTLTIEKNEMMQVIKTYVKAESPVQVNRQVIDEKAIKYTWGSDIKSNIQIFSDECLNVADIVIIAYKGENKTYEVEDKKDYDNHSIYALIEKDVDVNE